MKRSRRMIRILVLAAVIMSLISNTAFAAQPDPASVFVDTGTTVKQVPRTVSQPKNATGSALYIVQLADQPLVTYSGGVDNLQATSPRLTGVEKLDATSSRSVAYLSYLEQKRSDAISQIDATLGRTIDVAYIYDVVLNGFAAEMTPEEAAQVAQLPGVIFVEREIQYELHTDAGPVWIGADSIWDGADGIPSTKGEGVIVGVIDTGIDPWNPSFADVGGDGYDHTNPQGAGVYVGVCDPTNTNPPAGVTAYDPTFPCNDKLIGAWGYSTVNGGTPRDSDGHGSHTASTAAGNVVIDSEVKSPTGIYTATISGVAPHANIIAYAACCTSAALNAAINQIVLDGVDVVNYSIGAASATADPWGSSEAKAWLNARDAGIFVATSAGNNGPGPGTIGAPGDLPWLMSVGASSHNRAFLNTVLLDDSASQLTVSGQAMSSGYGPAPIVFAADFAEAAGIDPVDARLCADGVFPADTFDGQIVICERGVYGRVAKGETVKAGGAGGYILAQPDEFGGGPGSVSTDPHALPAVHIDYYEYQKLKTFIADATGPVNGTIGGAVLDTNPANGDVMASFSSRGPNRGMLPDLIVPNITAPGRAVWAAYHQGEGGDGDYTFNAISGTSMSSPHMAGAGALMVAARPSWTPAEIESALMLTARTVVTDDNGIDAATPFAQGAGRVDLSQAPKAGFVLDTTTDDFLAADPRQGGDVRTLNLASLGNASCVGSCMWTRTLKSTQDGPVDYVTSATVMSGTVTVEPASFTLAAGGTQVITVSVQINAGVTEADGWLFGQVDINPATDTAIPNAHMPVAVFFSPGDLPESITINAPRDAGSRHFSDLSSIAAPDLTVDVMGMTKAAQSQFDLFEDPTNGSFYDDLGQVHWMSIQVPADSQMLVAEIVETTSPDLDITVGFDSDGNGMPSADEEECISASATAFEFCQIDKPQAGTWWVVVQNWDASGTPPDPVTLATAVVPMTDSGNFNVVAPNSVDAGAPFDITVFWDADMVEGDRFYGAISLGTDAANPGNIGTIPVYLTRTENDVVKTASYAGPSGPKAGETLTYSIVVAPNSTSADLTYFITDTIPAGLTYVPGSVTGGATVNGNVVTWSGVQAVPNRKYAMTTSLDTAMCSMPLANSGAYVDLGAFGLKTNSAVSGNDVSFSVGWDGGSYPFFGDPRTDMLTFSDDGVVALGENALSGGPYVNTSMPSAAQPNALLALMWNDMEIVYDQATNRGATTGVRLTTGGVPSAKLLEFDDLQLVGDPTSTLDFELMLRNSINDAPGAYEIVYAYDNLTGAFASPVTGTIGLEDYDGVRGLQYAFNDANLQTLQDGMAICFDWFLEGTAHVITFDVTVDAGVEDFTVITNNVQSTTNNPGAKEETSSHDLIVGSRPIITVSPDPLSDAVPLGQSHLETVFVNNSGTQDLTWSVEESLGATMSESALAAANQATQIQRTDSAKSTVSPQQVQAIQAAAAHTVVADGSFEAGSPNPFWGEASTNGGSPLCDPDACGPELATDGSWYAWFGGWDSYEEGILTQTVTIPVTATVLGFDFFAGRCQDAGDYLEVSIDGNVVWSVDGASNLCNAVDYERQTLGIASYADGGTHLLEFYSEVNGNANDWSNFFIDKVSIEEGLLCTVGNISWARSVTPSAGTTKPGETSEFTVIFDSAGLDLGVYSGELCINSNDPNQPLILLPVEMTVAYPPVADDQTFSVSENSANGTVVGTVKVTDPDPADTKSLAILSGNEDGAFLLNGTTGQLTVADGSKIDYETKMSYVLSVVVTDSFGLTDDAQVTVNVTNVAEPKSLTLTAEPVSVKVGGSISVTATISDDMGGPVVGWPVSFSDGTFSASLNGANEVPPTSSTAVATATFTLDPVALNVSYEIQATGLISVTGAHVHAGGPAENGPVVFPLDTNTWKGTVPITADQLKQMVPMLLAGQFYVNIHTETNPAGDIRGQLTGPTMAVTDGNGQATISYTHAGWGPVTLFAASGSLTDSITVMFEAYSVYMPMATR